MAYRWDCKCGNPCADTYVCPACGHVTADRSPSHEEHLHITDMDRDFLSKRVKTGRWYAALDGREPGGLAVSATPSPGDDPRPEGGGEPDFYLDPCTDVDTFDIQGTQLGPIMEKDDRGYGDYVWAEDYKRLKHSHDRIAAAAEARGCERGTRETVARKAPERAIAKAREEARADGIAEGRRLGLAEAWDIVDKHLDEQRDEKPGDRLGALSTLYAVAESISHAARGEHTEGE